LESRLEESVVCTKGPSLSVTVLDRLTDGFDDLERPAAFLQGFAEQGFLGRFLGFDASSREEQSTPSVDDGSAPISVENDGVYGLAFRVALTPIRDAEHRNAPGCRGRTVHRSSPDHRSSS